MEDLTDNQLKHLARIIRGEVCFMNGCSVSEKTEVSACEIAAKKIAKYLKAQAGKDV